MKETTMTLYILYTYACMCIQYMSLYVSKPGVMRPTSNIFIGTLHSSQKVYNLLVGGWGGGGAYKKQFVFIETIISQ